MTQKTSRLSILLILCGLLLPNCSGPASTPTAAGQKDQMAIVMPGELDDQDYNHLAFVTGEEIKNTYNLSIQYIENIDVPSLPKEMDDLSRQGVKIIWLHGSQYDAQAYQLAAKYPKISFIIEGDIQPDILPDNLSFIDRNFQKGMYVLGRLAAMQSRTGKVGYICGLNLPFSYIELHAIMQAIHDSGQDIKVYPVWTGDFNNPGVARQETAKLLDSGVDVVIGSLNGGMAGLVDEMNKYGGDTWFTAKYTDKSALSTDHYTTSLLLDFTFPIKSIVSAIQQGNRNSVYEMDFSHGLDIQLPVRLVNPTVNQEIKDIIADLEAGKIEVDKNSQPDTHPTQTP